MGPVGHVGLMGPPNTSHPGPRPYGPRLRLIPEILKTQRYPEVFSSQELDDRLQVILLLSGDSDLTIL